MWISTLTAMFAFFLNVSVAEAHVTVWPQETTTNAYEKYTVRVPVEKEMNTTEVELEVPKGVDVVSVLPMSTWDYELKKDKEGRITHVIWKANDGGIGPNEFIEFAFIGANPSKPGKVSWKAVQTYADGSSVEWVGPPDSEEPASVTTIAAGDTVAPHGHTGSESASNEASQEAEAGAAADSSSNWLPIGLAALALLLSVISLFRNRT